MPGIVGARKALVVQNEAKEPPQRLATELTYSGVAWELVRAWTTEGRTRLMELGMLAQHAKPGEKWCAGVVVLGGPQSAYKLAEAPYLTDEVLILQAALEQQLPVLGICLGAQLLAVAAGAEVRASQPEIGWLPIKLMPSAATDPLCAGLPQPCLAFHWHGDACVLPSAAVHLACSALTAVQAFRLGERAWGLQFHPESTAEGIAGMARHFASELKLAKVDAAVVLGTPEQHRALDWLGQHMLGTWARLVRSTL